jgi:hypothetical protein
LNKIVMEFDMFVAGDEDEVEVMSMYIYR